MKTNVIVWMAVFVPIAGAFLLPLMGQLSKGLRNLSALALVTSSLICSSSLVPLVLAGGTESISLPFLATTLMLALYTKTAALGAAVTVTFLGQIIVCQCAGQSA